MSTSEKVLSQLLDAELEPKATLARRPPPPLPLTHSLTPVRKNHRLTRAQAGVPLKNSSVFLDMLSLSELDSPLSPTKDESTRSESVQSSCV